MRAAGDNKLVVCKRHPRKIFKHVIAVADFENKATEVFCKKSALENLANLTRKYL